jgi:hypothetical protein
MTNDTQVRALADALCSRTRVGHGVFPYHERPCAECFGLAYQLVGVIIVPHALTPADVQGLAACADNVEQVAKFLRHIGDTEC